MSRAVQVLTLLLAFSWPLAAQEMTPEDKADRVTAFHYFDVGNHVQALPLLERLAARYPKDADIHLRYGFALLGYSATIQDPEQRRAARARAHKIGLETQALGDKSNLLTALLDIPEDGRIAAFSGSKAADGRHAGRGGRLRTRRFAEGH